MANNDLFAPPTADELKMAPQQNVAQNDLFAPPSKEELGLGQSQTKSPGAGQSFLEHAGNALSFGYLPQLQAAAEPLMTRGLNAITGNNVKSDDYLPARDANIKRMQAEESANPKSSLAGTVAGSLVGAVATPLPELGLGKGILASGVKGAAYGAGQGALSNPGDTEGQIDPLQLKEREQNAIKGAKLGGVLGAGAGAIGRGIEGLQNSAEAAQNFANAKAVKAAGGMLKDFRTMNAKGLLNPVGQFALDNGIVKAGDSVESVAQKASDFNKQAGQNLSEIYSNATKNISSEMHPDVAGAIDQAGFNPIRDKGQILEAAKSKLGDSVEASGALSKLSSYLDDLGSKYGDATIDPKKANDIKGAMDEMINYSRNPLTKQPGIEQAFSAARNELNNKIASHIDAIGNVTDGSTADALRQANKDYGYSAQLKNMAKDRVSREEANRAFGLTDTIMGAGGMGLGGIIGHSIAGPVGGAEGAAAGALIGGGINKASRTYGPAIQASGANLAAKALRPTAAPAGEALSAIYNPNIAGRAATETGLLNKKKK